MLLGIHGNKKRNFGRESCKSRWRFEEKEERKGLGREEKWTSCVSTWEFGVLENRKLTFVNWANRSRNSRSRREIASGVPCNSRMFTGTNGNETKLNVSRMVKRFNWCGRFRFDFPLGYSSSWEARIICWRIWTRERSSGFVNFSLFKSYPPLRGEIFIKDVWSN